MTDAEKFLSVLARNLATEERLIMCAFRGDPNEAEPSSWRPRPWAPGNPIKFSERNNAYVGVASFGRVADGSYRRRKDAFKAGRALLIDDVGTKVDRPIVAGLQPTAIVETSPGNEQWWYALSSPVPDQDKFDQVIRAFIRSRLLGNDPGQSGVTRVGRLPGYRNGKVQYNGFITKLINLEPKRLFTIPQLVKHFKLELMGRRMPPGAVDRSIAVERVEAFYVHHKFLSRRKMLKRKAPDPSGWQEMHCPFIENHTGGADTGAAIREPSIENQYWGAFRCHHGHCLSKGWKDLTDWISDRAAEELA